MSGTTSSIASNATGKFYTSNGKIIDPNGNAFTAAGINLYDSQMGSASQVLADFPKINFVRLNVYSYQSPSAYSSFIQTMTSHGVVVELEDHTNSNGSNAGGGSGSVFTGSQLTNELNWYSSVASAYASNPYVWFGTNNEPPDSGAALSAWQQQTYNAVRDAGNSSPVLIEIDGWGDPASFASGYNAADYTNMTNAVADMHYYGWVTNYSVDQQTNNQFIAAAAAQTQATLPTANGAMPIIIGEYGPSTDGQSTDANANQAIAAVQSSGFGSAAWGWDSGQNDNLTDGSGNLTSFGQEVAQWIASRPTSTGLGSGSSTAKTSPNDTVVKAGSTAAITDTNGNQWTINGSAQVAINGVADTTTANVTEIAYVNGAIWQQNSAKLWWSETSPTAGWGPTAGTSTSPVPVAPPTSLNDTVIKAGSTAAITDANGNQWTINGSAQVAVNGVADTTTANVVELAYVSGAIWQENNNNLWWSETAPTGSWGPTAGTSVSPLPVTPVQDTITLRVSEDAWNGDAQFVVKLDGTQVGGTQTASATHSAGDANVVVLTAAHGLHTVQIQFLNDTYGGSAAADRNLYVNSIADNGITASGTTKAMMSNGTTSFSIGNAAAAATAPADALTIHLAQDAWNGNAQFTLAVDGKQVTTPQAVVASHSAGAWQDLSFAGSFGTGSHTIGITFTNDAYGGTAATDRNLYVNGIDLNGQHYGSGVTALMSNGTASFTVVTAH